MNESNKENSKGHRKYNTSIQNVEGKNIKKTYLHAVRLTTYYEKHKLAELIKKIIFEAGVQRPWNFAEWLSKNIRNFYNEQHYNKTVVKVPIGFDVNMIFKDAYHTYGIPTVVYTKKNKEETIDETYEKFNYFLEKHNVAKKHKIFFNFPLTCHKTFQRKKPDTSTAVTFNLSKINKNQLTQVEHTTKTNVGNYDKSRRRIYLNHNISHLTGTILNYSKTNYTSAKDVKERNFVYRIILFGRRGCGDKSLAKLICLRFKLIYVNLEDLIFHKTNDLEDFNILLKKDPQNYQYRVSYQVLKTIVYERLLKPDCIANGWVLCEFPFNDIGFNDLMNEFVTPPNKIFFIHVRERLCVHRLIRKIGGKQCGFQTEEVKTAHATNLISSINMEMKYYNLRKMKVLACLEKLPETVHIDGNHSFPTVQTDLFSKL